MSRWKILFGVSAVLAAATGCGGGGGSAGGGDTTLANTAPSFSSSGTLTVAENQSAVATLSATDPDAGASLTFSLSGGADQALFSIDASSGALSFVTAPDFESSADADSDNVYEVTAQVSDGSLTAALAMTITITDANEYNEYQVPSTVTIPAGTFTQGDQQGVGYTQELPLRQVTLSQSFQLATTEVTNAQYAAMLNWALDPDGDGNGGDAYIEVDNTTTPITVHNVATDPRDGTTAWQQQEILNMDSTFRQIV
jgi:formylglycine-generating enzyme required for sulfatase activity